MALALSLSQQQHQQLFSFETKDSNDNDNNNDDMINVFLKMWDGKTLCCVIDPHRAAIVGVMNALEQKVLQHYPATSRKSFFFEVGGKPLSNDSAFVTYNPNSNCAMKNGCTVFVQYRNRGGCFMISMSIMMIIFTLILSSTCTCGTSLLFVPLLLPFLFVLPLFCL